MSKIYNKWAYIGIIVLLIGIISFGKNTRSQTILFTHDLHDFFLPQTIETQGELKSMGGYSALGTLIKQSRESDEDLLLLDAGDYSMGTLFQTIYRSHNPQLQLMGQLGYDVVTLGNHEFDYGAKGLAQSLESAQKYGQTLPELVTSQIDFSSSESNKDVKALENAFKVYDVKEYVTLQKGEVKVGIFGLLGPDAQSNAPMAGVAFKDYIQNAKEMTKILEEQEKVDLIICLSHTGTDETKEKSEDVRLAKEVPDIDLIISGHTHTLLKEPIKVENTLIVSSGNYGHYLGKIELEEAGQGEWTLRNYELIEVNETIPQDLELAKQIQSFKDIVERVYLSLFNFTYDQVLARAPVSFEPSTQIGDIEGELRLANLISDAYRWAVQKAEGRDYVPITVSVVPSGTIRSSFVEGDITVSDVFEVSSLGMGEDESSGYPLVSAYLTGKELKTLCEVDASIGPIMPVAKLYMSGIKYEFNPHRLIFNKVTTAYLVDDQGKEVPIEEEKLYRVVAGLYSAQMLSIVGEQSFGILSLIPKDAQGEAITDFNDHIIYDSRTGNELKEWLAIAKYISNFEREDTLPIISHQYATIEGRKNIIVDQSLKARFEKPNGFACMVYGAAIIVVIGMGSMIYFIRKKIKGKKTR